VISTALPSGSLGLGHGVPESEGDHGPAAIDHLKARPAVEAAT
jgi:hypothetical protein